MSGTVGSVATCKHKQLARKCEICERDATIKLLLKALERCPVRCSHLSHRAGEFHLSGEDCPVEKMVPDAIETSRNTTEKNL